MNLGYLERHAEPQRHVKVFCDSWLNETVVLKRCGVGVGQVLENLPLNKCKIVFILFCLALFGVPPVLGHTESLSAPLSGFVGEPTAPDEAAYSSGHHFIRCAPTEGPPHPGNQNKPWLLIPEPAPCN